MSEARIFGADSNSFVYAGFYANFRDKFLWSFVSFTALLLFAGLSISTFSHQPSLTSLGLLFVLFTLSLFLVYQFLRVSFCPILQIYKTQIVFTGFRHFVVPTNNIRELEINGSRVRVTFTENDETKSIEVLVQPVVTKSKITIKDGKLLQSWKTGRELER